MQLPDAARPAEADVVRARMHINLGVIKTQNTAPRGLFKERKEGSDFPSPDSGGNKEKPGIPLPLRQPEHIARLQWLAGKSVLGEISGAS